MFSKVEMMMAAALALDLKCDKGEVLVGLLKDALVKYEEGARSPNCEKDEYLRFNGNRTKDYLLTGLKNETL